MLEIHAPAKINLFLRILAREQSGYHRIETLFCTLEFGDSLRLIPTEAGISLEVDDPSLGPVEKNLAFMAAQAFLGESGLGKGVEIHLSKRIPAGAGLGGGSSDAAATLRGLQALFPGAMDEAALLAIAGALGSDVPSFLSSSSLTLAWGRGERLLALPPLPSVPVVLALPPLSVATPHAYALLAEERREEPDGPRPNLVSVEGFSQWTSLERLAVNDFEGPVFGRYELLGQIRAALHESGAKPALLSGSGAALFGIFSDDSKAEAARDAMTRRFPDTCFVLTRTAGPRGASGG